MAYAGESIPCVTVVALADELLSRELVLRLGVFLGIFLLMNVWEIVAARRARPVNHSGIFIGAINTIQIVCRMVQSRWSNHE